MDVDKLSFYPLILDILTEISEAHFVAIDLELSGVPTKDSWGKESGKPTLQDRYLETKDAAERYQILQIGLTCVEQNVLDGKYVLRPYNFDLCPLISERGLEIERIFSFQSSAAEFLLKVGFDMNKPFTNGVPYLSRAEARAAREKHTRRQDRSAMADIQIKPTEVESLAFLERVRKEINAWDQSKDMEAPSSLIIAPLGYDSLVDSQRAPEELSRFEKRLVHQLVRAEYPQFVTISKRGFIQVVKFDQDREDRIAADRKRELEEKINRQKGFRWIIEALLGNSISQLDLREIARNTVTGDPIFADLDDYKLRFDRAQVFLRDNPKVLVGHNCFLDMVYLYRTFIGKLPDTVEEFQHKLHQLWPVVVDTKYMSTHNCGDISPVSSLEQIAQQLSTQPLPTVVIDNDHGKYTHAEVLHEAGYDSFLTAQIAVRLSAKLEREGAYVDVADGTNDVSNGVAAVKLEQQAPEQMDENCKTNGQSETKGFTPSVPGAKWKRRGDPTLEPQSKDDLFTYNPKDLKHRYEVPDLTIPDGMPRLKSDFWRVYGNKLRVFGTQEGVCVLGATSAAESATSEDDGGVGV